jgi:hypothetical protein
VHLAVRFDHRTSLKMVLWYLLTVRMELPEAFLLSLKAL